MVEIGSKELTHLGSMLNALQGNETFSLTSAGNREMFYLRKTSASFYSLSSLSIELDILLPHFSQSEHSGIFTQNYTHIFCI